MLNIVSDRIFTIPNFLSPTECAQLIGTAEREGFSSASVRTVDGQKSMPNIRNNDRVIVSAPDWRSILWKRLSAVGLPSIDEQKPVGLPRDLRFYRYAPGQRFKMHKDGPWHEDGLTSRLTLLVYLNHGYVGGITDFREHKIEPFTGMALLFVHDTWHEGTALCEGVKYLMRSDVLYA